MSPLTHTLTNTQTPLILTGSFAAIPEFVAKVHEVLDLVNPADMEVIVQQKHYIAQHKAQLTTLLQELKLSQKDYDFSDYEERLLLTDSEIENILENNIFRKDGALNELGKSFYGHLKLITEGKSEEIKGKMKKKLMREFALEDRVHETTQSILPENTSRQGIEFHNKIQFFQDIQKAGYSAICSLDLSYNSLSKKLDAPDFLELVKES
jgi:hypothetical protein